MMSASELLERSYPGRRADLKRDILRSALARFNSHGIEATTIEMIRTDCQTSVGAIYHHFGNKEGLIAALFFTALEDQARLRASYLAGVESAEAWVRTVVYCYVDWVDAHPEWARFQFAAQSSVASGPFRDELAERNKVRNKESMAWFSEPARQAALTNLPLPLLPAMIIGPAETYSRQWLAGRVADKPGVYREIFAEAAWRALGDRAVS